MCQIYLQWCHPNTISSFTTHVTNGNEKQDKSPCTIDDTCVDKIITYNDKSDKTDTTEAEKTKPSEPIDNINIVISKEQAFSRQCETIWYGPLHGNI